MITNTLLYNYKYDYFMSFKYVVLSSIVLNWLLYNAISLFMQVITLLYSYLSITKRN